MVRMQRKRRAVAKKRVPRKRVARPSRLLTQAVTTIINRKSETKEAAFYGSGAAFPQTGVYSAAAYSSQNQFINAVSTDVKVVLPYVPQGTDDWTRIGNKIQPLSLVIHGTTKVALAQTNPPNFAPTDIFAVLYVLTSKQLKSYGQFVNNVGAGPLSNLDLTGLLKTQEGGTTAFNGTIWDSKLQVAEQNFTVLVKKVIRLRYAGLISGSGVGTVSVANSHDYVANWTLRLKPGTHMPKTFTYPEGNNTPAPPPFILNSPTNYAPFMCMGYYKADGSPAGPAAVILENTYVSQLRYKDI